MRHALLLGATGLIGRHALACLLDDPGWARVTVLARRRGTASHAKLTWHQVDFARPSSWEPHTAVTDVFNCMGTTIKQAGSREAFLAADLHIPLAVCRAAQARGATHAALISSLGADASSRIFYSRVKGEVEAGARAVGFSSLHILRPSLLLGERAQTRPGEKVGEVLMGLLRPALAGPLRKYRAIAGADVARAMVTLAAAPEPGVRILLSDEIAALAIPTPGNVSTTGDGQAEARHVNRP